jgi:class 3 adenylate cyclase
LLALLRIFQYSFFIQNTYAESFSINTSYVTLKAKVRISMLRFSEEAKGGFNALVVLCDLEGFTKMISDFRDIEPYVPKFFNRLFNTFDINFRGGRSFWSNNDSDVLLGKLQDPIHVKFMGDGALYIWKRGSHDECLSDDDMVYLISRIWIYQQNFDKIIRYCSENIPLNFDKLPRRLRFGISAGQVYPLENVSENSSNLSIVEYFGYTINLASRLQNYCEGLSFIMSSRVVIPPTIMRSCQFVKLTPRDAIKGILDENIIVSQIDLDALDNTVKNQKFILKN